MVIRIGKICKYVDEIVLSSAKLEFISKAKC